MLLIVSEMLVQTRRRPAVEKEKNCPCPRIWNRRITQILGNDRDLYGDISKRDAGEGCHHEVDRRDVVGERGTEDPPIPARTNIDCASSSAYATHSKVFAASGGASRSLLGRCNGVSRQAELPRSTILWTVSCSRSVSLSCIGPRRRFRGTLLSLTGHPISDLFEAGRSGSQGI